MNLPKELKIPLQKTPIRLDKFLIEQFSDTSRSFWRKHLDQIVEVNGRRPKKGLVLEGGETLRFLKEKISLDEFPPTDTEVPVNVVFEDPSFLVVEKPAGIPSHPLDTEEKGTLVQGVLARYPEIGGVGKTKLEMGSVHRLDNETSGLLLIARNEEAYRFFREEFQRRRVEKEYAALVEGLIPQKKKDDWATIDWPIAHHPKNKKKMIVESGGRPSVTDYKIERRFSRHTLLRVRIPTGVRHQIRVHFAHMGHPIVGDHLYGPVGARCNLPLQDRMFLHASRLVFRHPRTLKKVECRLELPQDLKDILKGL